MQITIHSDFLPFSSHCPNRVYADIPIHWRDINSGKKKFTAEQLVSLMHSQMKGLTVPAWIIHLEQSYWLAIDKYLFLSLQRLMQLSILHHSFTLLNIFLFDPISFSTVLKYRLLRTLNFCFLHLQNQQLVLVGYFSYQLTKDKRRKRLSL